MNTPPSFDKEPGNTNRGRWSKGIHLPLLLYCLPKKEAMTTYRPRIIALYI